MHRYQDESQFNEFNGNDSEFADDEFTEEEVIELSARLRQLYGESLDDIAHQFDEYRNA